MLKLCKIFQLLYKIAKILIWSSKFDLSKKVFDLISELEIEN